MKRFIIGRRLFILGFIAAGLVGVLGFAPSNTTQSDVDVELSIRAIEQQVEIFPNTKTRVWSYVGEMIKGPANTLTPSNTYLGPTLRFHKGQRVKIHFLNELAESSIIHWHGLDVPSDMDGHPRSAVQAAGKYDYEFTVENRAGLYWYHPHPDMRTGIQVYQGLAGLLIVEDEEEAALNLPSGESESLLVLQDRQFDDQKQLQYVSGRMDQMMGMYGDTILVNGLLNIESTIPRGAHRIRVLNGSNARIYNLGWEDNRPLQVIGTDGGLLAQPIQRDRVMLAPGERLDLWVDFSDVEAGASVRLMSFPLGKKGDAFPVSNFHFSDQKASSIRLPQTLSRVEKIESSEAVNKDAPKIGEQFKTWLIKAWVMLWFQNT